jgi:hypothetical protein
MDFEVQRCTRRCAATGRELATGEEFFSSVVAEGARLVRRDYSSAAWSGPPPDAIAWWKSQIPGLQTRRQHWAPNDVMLQLFDELEPRPDQQDLRYVLALLLVRRRVMRLEDTERDPQGGETVVLYCPRRAETYRVPAISPDPLRVAAIQDELAKLLQSA